MLSRRLKKWFIRWDFAIWTVLAWGQVLTLMFMRLQKMATGFLWQNSMTYVFVSFRPPYLRVSMQSLINLISSKTFLRISPARNIAQAWTFARLFKYSSSFTSFILDFIIVEWCWWWCDSENRQEVTRSVYSLAESVSIPNIIILTNNLSLEYRTALKFGVVL